MSTEPTAELATLGARLGSLRWVQGPGGNVSVKTDGGELWVKASGTRLRDVATDAGHARVPLDEARAALAGDEEADTRLFGRRPRPSLETYFHALDGRVVAHTHALGVLLHACAAPNAPRPAGVTGEVPYARPGRGIALVMRNAFVDGEVQAIVLASHGLVVVAPTAARAIERTEQVDEAVRARFPGLRPIEAMVAEYMQLPARPFEGGILRAIAPRASAAASPPRYLFPDAVICASVILVDALTDPAALAARSIVETGGRAHQLVGPDGRRILVGKNEAQLDASTEVLAAHDWVEDALRAHASPVYLPPDEPARLLDLPSEQYRIRLAQS